MIGVKDIAPIVGAVEEDSLAERAGIEVGDKILSVDDKEVLSLKELNTTLALRVGETGSINVTYQKEKLGYEISKSVDIKNWLNSELDQSVLSSFGIRPLIPPIVSAVEDSSPADTSGIREGAVSYTHLRAHET